MTEPLIIAETTTYLVVYKPAGMHSAPLSEGEKGTLFAWCADVCPSVLEVRGRKEVEHGLLHRLDKETEGLVLLAKTQEAYDALSASQERGLFLKRYEAICAGSASEALSGRPLPFVIESGFRPFGPGRKAVRPVEFGAGGKWEIALDHGNPYRTEILSLSEVSFRGSIRALVIARLSRGFRHQVRSHLAWIGLPLVGDEVYGSADGKGLALNAFSFSFPDPATGSPVNYEFRR